MSQAPRTHLRFRIEPELQKQLEKARKESGRTLTAEITERLKKSFSGDAIKDLREELIRFRRGMMDEIHSKLDDLRMDLIERKDESQ
jgi:hypothetical protein